AVRDADHAAHRSLSLCFHAQTQRREAGSRRFPRGDDEMSDSEQSPQPGATNADASAPKARRNRPGSWLASLGALVLVGGPAGYGVHQHYEQHRMVMAGAAENRDFVPQRPVG